MPRQWFEPAAPAGGASFAGPSSVEEYRAAVSDGAQAYLLELSRESRSARTLGNLRHAAFKALWWFESSGASALHSKCPCCCGTASEDRTGDQAARLT